MARVRQPASRAASVLPQVRGTTVSRYAAATVSPYVSAMFVERRQSDSERQ
ncbi:hypothetical protein [Streptomyces sp. cg2]|uniref:hypothetical protein n=1 Tax=Streptomyces sp. cg2 TaxID=3238799 RepID=UPI0034E212D9